MDEDLRQLLETMRQENSAAHTETRRHSEEMAADTRRHSEQVAAEHAATRSKWRQIHAPTRSKWLHDSALIEGPDRRYALVALTHHPSGDAYLEELARTVDDLMQANAG